MSPDLPILFQASLTTGLAILVMSVVLPTPSRAADHLTGPHVQDQLTLYFVHGPDTADTRKILTLDEALAAGKVVVHETGSVNELTVENKSTTETIFIQAGDIVKGGQQDRTLANDLFLEPGSGKQPVQAFCVESGRWSKRGGEDDRAFRSSKNMLSSKELKLAAREKRTQQEVWDQVAALQDDLGDGVGAGVQSPQSASSLQLTLEHDAVQAKTQSQVDALVKLAAKHPDARGYVLVLGGEINSAEVYASNDLFMRLWPKLALAISTEALAHSSTPKAGAAPSMADVSAFLTKAENGAAQADPAPGNRMRATDETLMFEAGPSDSPKAHRSYFTK